MPLPERQAGETDDAFMDRCMGSEAIKEHGEHDQRVAICLKQAGLSRNSRLTAGVVERLCPECASWMRRNGVTSVSRRAFEGDGRFSLLSGSHKVTQRGDKVVIHDLELFVGFDPRIDEPGNERLKKYDKEAVSRVVDRTIALMERGQNPRLILGHNPDKPDDTKPPKPSIGDIFRLELADVDGVPGIVGDVEMKAVDFDAYIRSNAYPRRSAEIWPEGLLSEVALLGSETPARPLRDTKFSMCESAGLSGGPMMFARRFAALSYSAPGPGNVTPPGGNAVADDDRKDDESQKMINRIGELERENDMLKARLKAREDDMEEKEKSARALERAKVDNEARLKKLEDELSLSRSEHKREKYARKIDEMESEGFQVADRDGVLDRVVRAEEPDKELQFIKTLLRRGPVGQPPIDQGGIRLAGRDDVRATPDQMKRATRAATTRVSLEKIEPGSPEYQKKCEEYYLEELRRSA